MDERVRAPDLDRQWNRRRWSAHSGVAKAVVGVTDETTTQAICAFVVLRALRPMMHSRRLRTRSGSGVICHRTATRRPVPELPKIGGKNQPSCCDS